MRILFYAPLPTAEGRFFGGMSIFAKEIKSNRKIFESQNIIVDFFNTERFKRADKSKGKIRLENFINILKIIKDLKIYVKSNKLDIIHINTSVKLGFLKDLLVIKYVKRYFKGDIILHIHSSDMNEVFFNNSILSKYIVKLINKKVDKIIILSKKIRKDLMNIGVKKEKIYVIYNFQDAIKGSLKVNISSCKKQLLFLGLIDEKKGILDLIEAISRLDGNSYILNVAGKFNNTDIKNRIYKLIKEKKLQENVRFLGYIKNEIKNKILIDSDILILPSYTEGLPLCVLEGMAAGCAIVSTTVGTLPEVIKNGKNGYLVSPGEIEKISEKINLLINDKNLLSKIKSNNIKEAVSYSFNSFFNSLLNMYTR